jgi:hypothetical protein
MRAYQFAGKRPLLFALFLILLWMIVGALVVVHALSNLSVLIGLLALPGLVLSGSGFILVALLQLPLIAVFMWLLLRSFPRPEMPESPRFAAD